MKKQSTIDGLFKRKRVNSTQDFEKPSEIDLYENTPTSSIHVAVNPTSSNPTSSIPVVENSSKKAQLEANEIDLNTIERDPGLRMQIYDYPINQRDSIRRAYINLGPFQPKLPVYPKSGPKTHKRSFQVSWFKLFPWLEYSKSRDTTFCFPSFWNVTIWPTGIYYRWFSELEESGWEKMCLF
uniref:Uncharacterized protein n=1 Tax=Lactuca sativa TaxID=4236 RepID=A0A9R1X114_LACSA|nr:hypothetical protein LSAT_V11C800391780 [Lactuca sativa]